MSRDEAQALVGRLLNAANRRDLPGVMALYAADAVAVSPVFGEVKGRARIAATWQTLFSTFADLVVTISDMLVDADRIAVLSAIETTDRLGWFGLPATGGPISYRLVLLLTVADGAIVRDERIYDSTAVIERLEKARLDKELRTAAEVQRTLLSRTAHVNAFSESVGDSLPCRAIGGDFFEFVALPSGDVAIAMGDVAGKGPAAALLAALLQGMISTEAPAGGTPAAILSRMNQRLAARGLESRFATFVYGVLSSDGRLIYSIAGHNPPVLLSPGGSVRLTTGGPILGAFSDAIFEEETRFLRDGDTIVLFTDGVTEARDASDDEFGDDRLMTCLHTERSLAPAALLQRVLTTVAGFCRGAEQRDDITVTITRFCRSGGPV